MTLQTQATDSVAVDPGTRRPRSPLHGHSCRASAPFAAIRLGPSTYEVADALDGKNLLAFRIAGQGEWIALDRQVDDGWIEIAADILLLDPDVLFDFLQTHAVSISKLEKPEYKFEFDTFGIPWSAHLLCEREGQARFGNEAWKSARLPINAPNDPRARAIMTLLATTPDARDRFEPHISNWARRIAKGVTIQPI